MQLQAAAVAGRGPPSPTSVGALAADTAETARAANLTPETAEASGVKVGPEAMAMPRNSAGRSTPDVGLFSHPASKTASGNSAQMRAIPRSRWVADEDYRWLRPCAMAVSSIQSDELAFLRATFET